jgi:putative heme degradation protein
MALPPLTPEQSAAGLEKAAQVRQERAAAKAELTEGTLSLAAVVTGQDSRLQRAYVRQVLEALPGVGKVRAAAVMERIGIDAKRRVSGLGPVQRAALEQEFATVAA